MKKVNKNIIFLYGLPGSGKSYYAKEKCDELFNVQGYPKYKFISIDFDEILLNHKYDEEKILYNLLSEIEDKFYDENNVIIDGLITTNSQLKKIIDYIDENIDSKYKISYQLVWWEEDRENCLINDLGRRDIDSQNSIKNLPFEIPDLKILKKILPENVEKRQVYIKSPEAIWKAKIGCDDDILKSNSWSLGGDWRDCYGNSGNISAEPACEFVEFDNLLEKICPNISYLQYKKIKNYCCSIQIKDDNDWYGGRSQKAYHQCDLYKLHEILLEMNLI